MSVIDSKLLISNAVNWTIRPLIRLLIHWGIGYKDFSETMKQAFLEEASESIKKQDKELTASVLSVVSGVHRKDTSVFIKNDKQVTGFAPKSSAAFTVFSEWASNPKYLKNKRVPAPLNYAYGDEYESFTSLCESITSDIRPKTILDELSRLDLIEQEGDVVRLKKEVFIPEKDLEKKLDLFTRNISEHIEASVSNVIAQRPAVFERMASHGHLTEDDIQKLKTYVDKKAMDLLTLVYQRAEKLAEKNKSKKGDFQQFSFGIYLNHKQDKKK